MFKLLIVDDEEDVRESIKEMIDWASNDIEICGDASNGREAIEKLSILSPDLLIIDIRMPVMNGLEVIQAIQSLGINVKCIVLSGYDDFSFAQSALNNGACAYLLKPCLPEDILAAVNKVTASIKSSKANTEMMTRLKIQFNETLPLLKEKFLIGLIKSEGSINIRDLDKFGLFRLGIRPQNLLVASMAIDNYASFCLKRTNQDVEMMKFAIKNIAQELLSTRYCCELFEFSDEIIAILNIDSSVEDEALLVHFTEVKDTVNELLDFTISIGLGQPVDDVQELHLSYKLAAKSLEHRFFKGINSVLTVDPSEEMEANTSSYPIETEKELLSSIKTGCIDILENKLEHFFETLGHNISVETCTKSATTLLFSLFRLCTECNIETENTFDRNLDVVGHIRSFETLSDLKTYVLSVLKLVAGRFAAKKSNKVIDLALSYIGENYHCHIDLEAVATHVYITPAYFSVLFKQNVGISFVDYLNKIRVEKACILLKDPRLKTYEIASKVGYNDEKYFLQVFKKVTGLTPSQFRKG